MRVVRWVGLVVLFSLLGNGTSVRAQSSGAAPVPPRMDRSFDVQLFHPAVGAHSFITLDSAEVLEHRLWHFGLVANYQHQPFSYTLGSSDATVSPATVVPVRDLAMAELVAAIGIRNRFEIGAALPLAMSWGGDGFDAYGQTTGATEATAFGFGDLRVEGKGEVVGFGTDRAFLLSLSAGATVPTGDKSTFLGEKTVSGRLRALLEYQHGENLRAVALVGGLFLEKSVSLPPPESNAALYGGAGEIKPTDEIGVLAEVTGRVASKYSDTNPAEFDATMRFYLHSMLNLIMGAGFGLNQGIGSPVVRAYVGLGWAPDFRDRDHDGIPDVYDRCPDEPEDHDGFQDDDGCPDPDNDGDGIPDALDKCPNEPEDKDGFQDDDGCPDLDNDGDGIPDLNDACPNEKEDGKGKRPTDGCPSTSEDSDGIPDKLDKCPNEPEDFDGFQDQDGCPDPDNDGDGIPDKIDKCPNEPETFNHYKDEDGCPDEVPPEVKKFTGVIEGINFKTASAEILPGSFAILDRALKVLQDFPDVNLEISGHTDSKGKASYNLTLSQHRADSVKMYFVSRGIASTRLLSVGYGKDRPIADNSTASGRATNRRTEFKLIDAGGK